MKNTYKNTDTTVLQTEKLFYCLHLSITLKDQKMNTMRNDNLTP